MAGLHYFVASPNPSIEDTGTTQSASSSNIITWPDAGNLSTSLNSGPTDNVRRLLPASTITNVQVHDIVILASSVEPITSPGTSSFGHIAGHIADTVCRNPSSIVGTGTTFTARRVRVQCKCVKSGYVVAKAARITSSKADAGSGTADVSSGTVDVGSGMQERLKHMLFEMRVLTHEPLMFHDNIVRFLGITWEDDTRDLTTKWPSIVLEYADAGTLAKAISNNIIPQQRRLKLCLDVANGLSALHECGIIHSDVKPQNILLFTDEKLGLVAKVADFGFSLVESGEGGYLPAKTPPWTAPEWREWIPIGSLAKTDVYSFGLLVWAVMTNCKDPFQDVSLGATLDSHAITILKKSDTEMMRTISSHLQECVLSGRTYERDYTTAWNVLQCTARKDPQLRDLTRAIELLNKDIPISERTAHDDDDTVVGNSCRRFWDECTKGSAAPATSEYVLYLCRFLARTTRISNRELVELQQKNGGRIDEKFFGQYCDLADQKMRSRKRIVHRPVDEIRVLPASASDTPTTKKHINPNLVALELSKFSANGVRRLYPDIQDMVQGSLIKAAEAGSADAALYLAIFYTNVHFNSAKACHYMLRAADLRSSSAMYLCYRFYKAHGIQLPFSDIQLMTWFHTGICWGSQVAYEDAKEADPGAIWASTVTLQLQGSFYGDTPFKAAEAAGPFNVMRDDFATTMRHISSLNQHIDDVTIAGGNGDKLLHWAAAMHGAPIQKHKGLLKDLLTQGQTNPNVRNAKGETPLLVAMRARNGQAIFELLKHGADPSLASNSGQVPLHWLWTLPDYRQGSEEDEQGLKLLAAALSRGSGQISLFYNATDAVADAVATRINDSWEADQIIRLQAHMFSELPAGTPLHWAVKRRSIVTVKALLAAGAKPSTSAYGAQSTAGTGETHPLSAFHLAAAMHDDDILKLFAKAEPDVLRNLDLCPLAVAIDGNVSNGYANGRIERMIRHGASYQARAKRTFEWFWRQNYRKLGKGFDQNSPGMTWKPCTPLILAVQAGQVDIVKALLNTPFRSSLEIQGGIGNHSPLQESIKQRCDEAYFLLRRHGASVSSDTDIGEGGVASNLALVAEFGHNRLDVANDLINAGVSVVAGHPMNKPPLLVAIAGGFFPLVRLLLDRGADPNELRGCICGIHRLDDGAIDMPTTVFGCLLLQFGHHKLLPLTWILDEYMAGRLAKPLQTIICPKTGFNVFHQLGFCQEEGRDDEAIISAFKKLRAAFPDISLLNDVAIVRESRTLGHLRLTPLYLAVEVSNTKLVREMLKDGADPSTDLGGGLTVLQHGRKALAEFERYLAAAMLPKWLMPADTAEIPDMLMRRKEIVELLEQKEEAVGSMGQVVDLAAKLQAQGNLDDAAAKVGGVLDKQQRVPRDGVIEEIAFSVGDLSSLNEVAMREVLEKRQRILGDEHLDTLQAMINLAATFQAQDKLNEAAAMLKEVLDKLRRIKGDEHSSTIQVTAKIAFVLKDQGKIDESAVMLNEVLEKQRRLLGDEHPETILTMNNYAAILQAQGKFDEGATMFREVVDKQRRVLGDEHPYTIQAMANLASLLKDQGKFDEAVAMLNEVLKTQRRLLGDSHLSTISTMDNLASILQEQGEFTAAIAMWREVLKKRQEVLGEEDPATISVVANLTIELYAQGEFDEAEATVSGVLDKWPRILDNEPTSAVMMAMHNFAIALEALEMLDEATMILSKICERARQVFGDEHPLTIKTMANLTSILEDTGLEDTGLEDDWLEDTGYLSETSVTSEDVQQILDDEHSSTTSAMNNLAIT